MTSPSPAPRVPGWEILGRLGAGAMGVVWKARRADGTLAALKVSRDAASLVPGAAGALFRREALACMNADHVHLVRGLDAGTTADGRTFLAMEFVDGETLDAAIRRDGPMTEARALAVAAALARALDYAHRLGLVHRDVKPRNVMLVPDGGVKLLDLGLVVETAEGAGTHGFGTPGFAAPEIVAGVKAAPQSDLFSLGATLFAAVTGKIPDKSRGVAGASLPDDAGAGPLSSGFRKVVERLVRAEPSARYASAAELILDLDALAAGERPLGAILGTGGSRVVRRWPGIAAVAAIAGVAAVWFAVRTPPPSPDPAPAAPAPAPVAAAREDAVLAAAKVYVQRFPDDWSRGREMLDEAAARELTSEERNDLAEIRGAFDRRFTAAAERALADLTARAEVAARANDFDRAREILAEWPVALRGSPLEKEASRRADAWVLGARSASEDLLGRARSALGRCSAEPDAARAALASLDEALARPRFDGDRHDEIAALRGQIATALAAEAERSASAVNSAAAHKAWTAAVEAQTASPTPEHFRAMLDAAPPELSMPAAVISAASERGEMAVADAVSALRGRPWCGPRGDVLFVGIVEASPDAESLFLSPLWTISGGRDEALSSAAGGATEAAAWLAARGRATRSIRAGDAMDAVAAALPAARDDAASPPRIAGFDRSLALREPGARPAAPAAGDTVVDAWAAAVLGKPRPRSETANPAKTSGRDAFLKDDFAAAASSLARAAQADPWDAEVAALRGRVLLVCARTMPTAPALLIAFSEGRRAWDLDPKLSAGPQLAADAGIDLAAVADARLSASVRPLAAAACEAADGAGRADGRMLAFAGEWHLAEGRTPKAVTLLRRAAALAPESGPIALSVARAELAARHPDKARDALRRARELFHGELPPSADDVVRALGEK